VKVRTRSYSVVKPPEAEAEPVLVKFLVLVRFGGVGGSYGYEGYTAAGEHVDHFGGTLAGVSGVGCSIHPSPAEGLAQGMRLIRDENTGNLLAVDFLAPEGLEVYTYTPPSPWIATAGQKVGSEYFWLEWLADEEDAPSTSVRLVKSASAKLTEPEVVETAVVDSTILTVGDWRSARGPDFTTSAAALWLEVNNEISFWERIVFALGGSSVEQRAAAVGDFPSVLRAGHPIGTVSITQTSEDAAPGETEALPVVSWGGGAEDDYEPWGSVGNARDIAPDPTSGLWVLKSTSQLERYSSSGGLLETVELDSGFPGAVGLHVLADPILVEDEGEGEGE